MGDMIMTNGDMMEPKFMQEGYAYIGEDEQWHIRDDAPKWAKKEFDEFFAMVNPEPDDDDMSVQR